MDLLKTIFLLLAPALKSIGPAGRAMIIAALVFSVGIGSYVLNHRGADKHVMLFGGRDLSRAEINTIENALSAASCNEYEVVENRIRIPISSRSQVLKTIDDAGATPRSVSGLQHSEQTFNPFLTGSQQKSLEKDKKQQKICAMIREIKGISEVMVEYDETRSTGFPRKTEHTAAVTVRPDGQRSLESYEVETIRSMVRRAVAGMEPDDIVVIDGNSGIAHQWQAERNDSQTLRDYAVAKQHFEKSWKQKIQDVLKSYPGAEINVQVEFDQVVQSRVLQVPVAVEPLATASQDDAATPTANTRPQLQAVARIRSGMPGSNGQARVSEILVTAGPQQQSVANPTHASVSHQTVSHQTVSHQTVSHQTVTQAGFAEQPVATGRMDFAPNSASVSIVIPQALVVNYARRIVSARNKKDASKQRASEKNAGDLPADDTPISITNIDIENCFAKLQKDITQRVTPLLPGSHQTNDPQRFIAVSMDMNLSDQPAAKSTGFDLQGVLSSIELSKFIDLSKFKDNWFAWMIPVVAVMGLVMLRINSRANAAAVRRDRLQCDAEERRRPAPSSSEQQEFAPQQFAPPEIEHNELEPTEQEVQLATDIDKAFDNGHDSSLSKDVVDLIKDDPETTIRVFRDWLNEVEN